MMYFCFVRSLDTFPAKTSEHDSLTYDEKRQAIQAMSSRRKYLYMNFELEKIRKQP